MRLISPSIMLLGLLALVLPVLDIRCAGQSVATQNGIQAILGEHTVATGMNDAKGPGGKPGGGPGGVEAGKKTAAAPLVMVWAGLVAAGAVLGFLMPLSSTRVTVLSLLGLGAAAALLVQAFVLKFPLAKDVDKMNADLKAGMKEGMQGGGMPGLPGGGLPGGPGADAKFEVKYGLGFWLGVVAPLGACAAALAAGGGTRPSQRPYGNEDA